MTYPNNSNIAERSTPENDRRSVVPIRLTEKLPAVDMATPSGSKSMEHVDAILVPAELREWKQARLARLKKKVHDIIKKDSGKLLHYLECFEFYEDGTLVTTPGVQAREQSQSFKRFLKWHYDIMTTAAEAEPGLYDKKIVRIMKALNKSKESELAFFYMELCKKFFQAKEEGSFVSSIYINTK